MIPIAKETMEIGGALQSVADVLGVNYATLRRWIKHAEDGTGNEIHSQLRNAIQEGAAIAHRRALQAACAFKDPRDAQWWLTHNPTTRDTWSDAAADRRTAANILTAVIKALDASAIPPDQRQNLLLHIQAQGLQLPPADADS